MTFDAKMEEKDILFSLLTFSVIFLVNLPTAETKYVEGHLKSDDVSPKNLLFSWPSAYSLKNKEVFILGSGHY